MDHAPSDVRQVRVAREPWGARHAPRASPGARRFSLVYLARHGQTQSNVLRRYAGYSAEPMTDFGRGQVSGLAARLGRCGLGEIWTSEVPRARESAELVGSVLGLPVRADERLNEMRLGPWEGMTELEVAREYPTAWATWCTLPDRLTLEGREPLEAVSARVAAAVRDAGQMRRPVLLMSHVAPIRVAVLAVLGLPLRQYKRLHVGNADAVVVDRGKAEALRLGEERSLQHEFPLSAPESSPG